MSNDVTPGSAWGGVAPTAAEQPRARAVDGRGPLDRRALEEAMILGGQRGSEDQRAVRKGELDALVDGLAGELNQQFQVPIRELSGLIADPALLFRNAGLSAPEIVDVLPTTDNFPGRLVFLTTDNKLYRWTGTEWTAAVPAVDVIGQLTNEQIAEIEAAKIAGQLTDAQIASINAAKIAGQIATAQIDDQAITDAKIAGLAASKITGQLTDAQIAAIAAAKLTGQITETQISDDAITTPKIAAGAVSAAEIAAGAVVADKIASNAVTAVKIQAGAVEAAKIAAGAIDATKIAAGAVTADKVAANAIAAGNIISGAVTTEKLAAGAVTADTIATNAVTAVKISAGAVEAAKIAAGAVVADKIATNAVTAVKIAAGAIEADKIAGNTITGDKIVANTITGGLLATSGIITQAAQIGNGIITNAQISNLEADRITAEKIDTRGLSVRDAEGNIILASGSPLASQNVAIDYQSLNGNLFFNGNFTIVGNNGGPAGCFKTLNTGAPIEAVKYFDPERTIAEIGNDTGEEAGVALASFRVDQTVTYKLAFRIRTTLAAQGGFFIQAFESDVELPVGAKYIGTERPVAPDVTTPDGGVELSRARLVGPVVTAANTAVTVDLVNSPPVADPLTILGTPTSANGTVTVGADSQSITFTPEPGFSGSTLVEYTLANSSGAITKSTLAVLVLGAGDSTAEWQEYVVDYQPSPSCKWASIALINQIDAGATLGEGQEANKLLVDRLVIVPSQTKITADNISTYIDNAAIRTAQIGDLQVENAKIADLTVGGEKIQNGAVTSAGAAYGSVGSLTRYVWTTVASLSLSTLGARVISFTASGDCLGNNIRVLVNGVVFRQLTIAIRTTVSGGEAAFVSYFPGSYSTTVAATSTAGSTLLQIQAYKSDQEYTGFADGYITAIELKK